MFCWNRTRNRLNCIRDDHILENMKKIQKFSVFRSFPNFLMESSEPILYDRITLDHDWKTDSETREVLSGNAVQSSGQTLGQSWIPGIFGRISSFLRASGISSNSPSQLPVAMAKFLEICHPWQISLSPCGTYLAILQRSHLELRSSNDGFEAAKRCPIPKDRNPNWRKISWARRSWNNQGAMAITHSNGKGR